ncbi:hypothetical protein ABEX25_12595 [Paenibacillus thiaminolyticus]|uniref:hypothetical protein n=1 Tax=Paenibacillus thiaminolyticus TaxID=49283 RepID=UPI003D2A4630
MTPMNWSWADLSWQEPEEARRAAERMEWISAEISGMNSPPADDVSRSAAGFAVPGVRIINEAMELPACLIG